MSQEEALPSVQISEVPVEAGKPAEALRPLNFAGDRSHMLDYYIMSRALQGRGGAVGQIPPSFVGGHGVSASVSDHPYIQVPIGSFGPPTAFIGLGIPVYGPADLETPSSNGAVPHPDQKVVPVTSVVRGTASLAFMLLIVCVVVEHVSGTVLVHPLIVAVGLVISTGFYFMGVVGGQKHSTGAGS